MRAPTPDSERSGSVSALKPIFACAGVSDWARAAPEPPINEESSTRLDRDIVVFSSVDQDMDQTYYVLIRPPCRLTNELWGLAQKDYARGLPSGEAAHQTFAMVT